MRLNLDACSSAQRSDIELGVPGARRGGGAIIARMRACPRCGAENVDEAKFCHQCATPLDSRAEERRERRVVSVLFADLVGYTTRAERSDVEDVESFLRGYYDLLRGELERYGGRVEKFIGDAVVAVFGAPSAHEDDAERAVRAGLAIQEAVDGLRERDGAELHVRVGITSGEVLLASSSDGDVKVVGDVVNTAARLQAAAPSDQVLVESPPTGRPTAPSCTTRTKPWPRRARPTPSQRGGPSNRGRSCRISIDRMTCPWSAGRARSGNCRRCSTAPWVSRQPSS